MPLTFTRNSKQFQVIGHTRITPLGSLCCMSAIDSDTAMRLTAFAHMRHLMELRDVLTANNLAEGFRFAGERIPLINPRRGIFRPTQMRYLLSIKTVFPKPGGRVWYERRVRWLGPALLCQVVGRTRIVSSRSCVLPQWQRMESVRSRASAPRGVR